MDAALAAQQPEIPASQAAKHTKTGMRASATRVSLSPAIPTNIQTNSFQ